MYTETGYVVIRNLLNQETLDLIKQKWHILRSNNSFRESGDDHVPGAPAIYGEFDDVLNLLNPTVEKTVGEKVYSTYSYAREYPTSSELDKHLDRKSCQHSITLSIEGSWPFYIEDLNGKEIEINLNPGDAILYQGWKIFHWRNAYTGKDPVKQIFLHYNEDPALEKDGRISFGTRKGSNKDRDLTDFIMIIPNVLSDYEINLVLDEYKNTNEWVSAETKTGFNPEIRKCDEILISDPATIAKNTQPRKNIDDIFCNAVKNCYENYSARYGTLVREDTGYILLKYKMGDFYKQHIDHFIQDPRTLSISIGLNDDYSGGEFSFWNGDVAFKLPKGAAVVFPSNFMYPHGVNQVTSGERFSMVTWLR